MTRLMAIVALGFALLLVNVATTEIAERLSLRLPGLPAYAEEQDGTEEQAGADTAETEAANEVAPSSDGSDAAVPDESASRSPPDDSIETDDTDLEPVRSPDIFVPSEDISEDLEVTFPVDI